MKALFALAALALLPTSALAEKVYAGSRGGFHCEDPEDIVKTAAGRMKVADFPLAASCTKIDPYTTIDAAKVETLSNDTTAGVGALAGGKPVLFVIYKDIPKPSSYGRTFKKVSPNDVRNSPDKWQGRDIEFSNVQVYWVGDADVRLLTGTNMTIFASDVRGGDVQFLRQECETAKEADSRKCRVTLRFSYQAHGEDKPNGFMSRTVLRTNDAELIRVGKR